MPRKTQPPVTWTAPGPADRDALLAMGSALSRCLQDLAAIETDDQSTDDLLEVAYAAVERWMNQCAACVQRLKTTEPPCTSR